MYAQRFVSLINIAMVFIFQYKIPKMLYIITIIKTINQIISEVLSSLNQVKFQHFIIAKSK